MDCDLDGFTTVKKRRHSKSSSVSSVSSVTSSASHTMKLRKEEDEARQLSRKANNTYCLSLRFQTVPNVILVAKGLRSLKLDGNVELARINANNFKISVSNPHAMNKLLTTPINVPVDWSSLGNFTMDLFKNFKTSTSTTSYTFVIKNVDMALTDDDIKSELLQNGYPITGVKRITSAMTSKLTSIVRVFTKSDSFMQDCINNGMSFFLIRHYCEQSNSFSIQCAKCLQLGHARQDCRASLACHKCGGPHLANSCVIEGRHCFLCGGNHSSTAAECPKKISYRQKRMEKVSTEGMAQPNAWKNGPPKLEPVIKPCVKEFVNARKPVSDAFCKHGCIAANFPEILKMLIDAVLNACKTAFVEDTTTTQGFLDILVRNFFNDY